jgi:hypothetical protein
MVRSTIEHSVAENVELADIATVILINMSLRGKCKLLYKLLFPLWELEVGIGQSFDKVCVKNV